MQGNYGDQPLPYLGTPQVIQPIYPGFNGASTPVQYNRKAAMGLGITQMIIGILCLAENIVLIANNGRFYLSYIAYGIWGGILIFVAGLLQVLSAKKVENKCLIIGTMVMTIIAACASAVIGGFSIDQAISGDKMRPNDYYYTSNYARSYDNYNNHVGTIDLAIGTVMVILASVEAVIAIITSALCCGAVCCKPSNVAPIPVYIVGNHFPGQSPFSGQPSIPQVPFNSSPQVPITSGLARNPPPSYDIPYDTEKK